MDKIERGFSSDCMIATTNFISNCFSSMSSSEQNGQKSHGYQSASEYYCAAAKTVSLLQNMELKNELDRSCFCLCLLKYLEAGLCFWLEARNMNYKIKEGENYD